MALIDYYRKYMYGQAPQDLGISGGQRLQEGTTGLFGAGGQTGGGLLNNFQRPDGGAVFDILSNPYVGIGGALFTAGQRGQSIGQAGMESTLQGLQFSETASKLEGARKKRQLIEEYKNKIPEKDRTEFELDPVAYLKSKRVVDLTADQKNFAAYKKIMETGTEDEKKLARDIFAKGGRNVKSKEEFLIGVTNNLSKDITLSVEDIQKKLPEYEKIYDKIVGDIDSSSKGQNILEVPTNKKDLINGQTYNIDGTPMVWDEKLDRFK